MWYWAPVFGFYLPGNFRAEFPKRPGIYFYVRSIPSPRPQVALLVATNATRFAEVALQGQRVQIRSTSGAGAGHWLRVGLGPLAIRLRAHPPTRGLSPANRVGKVPEVVVVPRRK